MNYVSQEGNDGNVPSISGNHNPCNSCTSRNVNHFKTVNHATAQKINNFDSTGLKERYHHYNITDKITTVVNNCNDNVQSQDEILECITSDKDCIFENNLNDIDGSNAAGKIGFVPHGPLKLFDINKNQRVEHPRNKMIYPLDYFEALVNEVVPNFMGKRLRVPSALNITAWRAHLVHYWDAR